MPGIRWLPPFRQTGGYGVVADAQRARTGVDKRGSSRVATLPPHPILASRSVLSSNGFDVSRRFRPSRSGNSHIAKSDQVRWRSMPLEVSRRRILRSAGHRAGSFARQFRKNSSPLLRARAPVPHESTALSLIAYPVVLLLSIFSPRKPVFLRICTCNLGQIHKRRTTEHTDRRRQRLARSDGNEAKAEWQNTETILATKSTRKHKRQRLHREERH